VARNEIVLLDQIIEARQAALASPPSIGDAFELFGCEQALRERDLSLDEIEQGVVGGGNDGAIDGVYVFLGDNLLADDSDLFDDAFPATQVPPRARLLLWLVQTKHEESFTETAIDLVRDSTRRLLDLSQEEEDLRELYSEAVVSRTGIFRSALRKLAARHPQVEVRFSYVTRGSVQDANAKVLIKANELDQHFKDMLPKANARVELLGAAELWKRASELPSYTLELKYRENSTSGNSHVGIVSLGDYMEFLADESGALRRHIFDWNVRDYQGNVEVNREIERSLQADDAPEFWWLNNGVTIICSRASIQSKTYYMDDVQIVNGLQTSHTIYSTLSKQSADHAARDKAILVRILVADDASTRDQVIRATNRQTNVPAASLRATDDVQRSVEAYFAANGWYYDRRKNYYRNLGKTPERIVSIPLLAQAVMAMGLSRPDNSRARPSSLLKRDDDYRQIFSEALPLPVYLWLAKAQKDIDSFLLTPAAATTPPERTNLRFHLAMLAVAKLFGGKVYAPAQLNALATEDRPVADADLPECLLELRARLAELGRQTGDTTDKLAKGPELVDYILQRAFPGEVQQKASKSGAS
jgi:AIPR protein